MLLPVPQLVVWFVAKRHRHYYEGDSDNNSAEASKRRRVVELSPPAPRASESTSAQRLIHAQRRKQPGKTSRFITDSEDDGSSDEDGAGQVNDSDEEFTLSTGRRAATRRKSPPAKPSRSMLFSISHRTVEDPEFLKTHPDAPWVF